MGRVYQLLTRLCVLIWIVMPCYGQSINNIISGASGLTGVTGIGTTEVLLYTNHTASYKGKTFKFPQTTTAGFSEMQALFPFTNNTVPNCISFKLADSGYYDYSTQIIFSNFVTVRGQGPQSSILRYVGSTNIVTLNSITNVVRQIVENTGYLPTTNDVISCGLICCIGTVGLPSIASSTNFGGIFSFSDVGFITTQDFPCVELFTGISQWMDIYHCGFYSQDSFAATNGLNMFYQNGSFSTGISVLPLVSVARNSITVIDSYFCNLAVGPIITGNTIITFAANTVSSIGNAGSKTNTYPASSFLSVPFGFFSSSDTFYASIVGCNNNGTDVPYVFGGGLFDVVGSSFQNAQASVVGTLDSGSGGTFPIGTWHSTFGGINIPICDVRKDGSGNWVSSTTNADVMNNIDMVSIGNSGSGFSLIDNNKLIFQGATFSAAGVGTSTLINPLICNSNINCQSITTSLSNTLAVASTGVTNTTTANYLLTITAGTGMTLKDGAGHTIIVPVANETVPLKPTWGVVGTGITGQCIEQ